MQTCEFLVDSWPSLETVRFVLFGEIQKINDWEAEKKEVANHTCTEHEVIAPRCGPIKSNYSSLFLINTTDTAIKSTHSLSYIQKTLSEDLFICNLREN